MNILRRLGLVDWRFFARQVKWALQWHMYMPESTDIARAIDDGESEKAKPLLADFERLIGDTDYPEIIHYRTLIEFEEEFPDLIDDDELDKNCEELYL